MRTVGEILEEALDLTEDERIELADALEDSTLSPEEREVKAEWDAEIKRRIDAHDAGLTVGIPAEQVMEEVQAKLREVREERRVRRSG